MTLKLALQWELRLLVLRGPQSQLMGLLRRPSLLPLWMAAWSSFRVCLDVVNVSLETASELRSLSRVAVQLGSALLGSFELGEIPAIDLVRNFSVPSAAVVSSNEDFARRCGEIVEPVSLSISQMGADQGSALLNIIACAERLCRQLDEEGQLPMARIIKLWSIAVHTKVAGIQFQTALQANGPAGLIVPSGGPASSSHDPA